MIKPIFYSSVLLIMTAITGEAIAACGTNLVNNLKLVLPGNTICQGTPGNWTAQEIHIGATGTSISGNLIDYKKGETDAVDQTKTLGTYALSNVGPQNCTTTNNPGNNACNRVTYNYTAFGPPNNTYTFLVYLVSGTTGGAGSVYDFCLSTTGPASATGTLKLGTGSGC